jgi:7-keto-8-aminopelargonate synthetase-like enzyme
VHTLGLPTPNRSGLPIIEIPLAQPDQIDAVGQYLFDQGIYVTLAAYPLVPRNQVGFRIQITAANTIDEIEQLCDVLTQMVEHFQIPPVPIHATT